MAHDSVDLGTACEMGEEIHATYQREMEATWGPDHLTTVPEDYAQHVIFGVCVTNYMLSQFMSPFNSQSPFVMVYLSPISCSPSPTSGYST